MVEYLDIPNFLDTILRVPPLFVIDEILKGTFYFSPQQHLKLSQKYILKAMQHKISKYPGEELKEKFGIEIFDKNFWLQNSSEFLMNQSNFEPSDNTAFDGNLFFYSISARILFSAIAVFFSYIVFLLSRENLQKFYGFLFSIALIICSYKLNLYVVSSYLKATETMAHSSILQLFLSLNISELMNCGESAVYICINYFCQTTIGLLFIASIQLLRESVFRRFFVLLSFILPSFVLLLPVPNSLLNNLPLFTALVPLLLLKFILMVNFLKYLAVIFNGYRYAKLILEVYGIDSLVQNEWSRLNVPNVLRTFWTIRTAQHLVHILAKYRPLDEFPRYYVLPLHLYDFYPIFKELMISGCDTTIALIGMTSVVSYIGHYIGLLIQRVLLVDENENMGTVCAVLFFILGEQSGLTMLDSEKRFSRLGQNFSFLFTSILHFTHNTVSPLLMSLSASRCAVPHKHIRALFVSFLLVALPSLVILYSWNTYPFSSWLLGVTALSAQVIIKTIVSILIYLTFLIDAYTSKLEENLDDYIYYIQAFGNTIDFLFGIVLFFTGIWIYFIEAGGSIRATMICIHAYFNIWCEAKNGWKVFMKRRTAVNKINSLPDASEEMLRKHDDVCTICFQDLTTAKITRCNHLFHSICLRKWLYVQDSCPLCQATLYRVDNLNDQNLSGVPDNNGGIVQPSEDDTSSEDDSEHDFEDGLNHQSNNEDTNMNNENDSNTNNGQ